MTTSAHDAKVDFKKTLDCYRAKSGKFDVIDVPDLQYLMIDGHGDPNSSAEYTQSLEALYPLAYKLKFASKKELGRDYVVPPLEGLWWASDMDAFTVARDKSQWDWTMMIMVPDWISRVFFDAVFAAIPANDLRLTGKHHEIYLSDPRKTAPEKLRTILRQPVQPS